MIKFSLIVGLCKQFISSHDLSINGNQRHKPKHYIHMQRLMWPYWVPHLYFTQHQHLTRQTARSLERFAAPEYCSKLKLQSVRYSGSHSYSRYMNPFCAFSAKLFVLLAGKRITILFYTNIWTGVNYRKYAHKIKWAVSRPGSASVGQTRISKATR